MKTRRVHQEAFLSTARIFRTGGGFLRYGMHPDMLNCSRCELLSDFLSYPFPITTAMVDTFANCMIKFQYWQFLTSPLHGRLEPIFFWFESLSHSRESLVIFSYICRCNIPKENCKNILIAFAIYSVLQKRRKFLSNGRVSQ